MPNSISNLKEAFFRFVLPKVKFAFTSAIATLVDIGLYLLLEKLNRDVAYVVAKFTGMVINFLLQRKFIFVLNRKARSAFLYSMLFWAIGLGIGRMVLMALNMSEFLDERQYIAKPIETGIMFFYSFYTKKFAFEKKLKNLKYVSEDKEEEK